MTENPTTFVLRESKHDDVTRHCHPDSTPTHLSSTQSIQDPRVPVFSSQLLGHSCLVYKVDGAFGICFIWTSSLNSSWRPLDLVTVPISRKQKRL